MVWCCFPIKNLIEISLPALYFVYFEIATYLSTLKYVININSSFIIMKVVLQILTWNFNESCASNPDLELHHVNFVMKLMYVLWTNPQISLELHHLDFVMKLRYVLWHKPSNFTWTKYLYQVYILCNLKLLPTFPLLNMLLTLTHLS
jgi:hypothetical protein